MFKKLTDRFSNEVWHTDVYSMTRSRRVMIYWVRMFQVLFEEILSGDLRMRAMGLVYVSILSLVPLLAFAFALLKGFGVQNKLEPILLDMFSTLGDKGPAIADKVIDFVNNVKAGVLGTFGLVALLYTVIALVRKVEASFNHTWRVREHRSIVAGFGHYLSVILVGPLLFVAALGVTATLSSHTAVQSITDWAPAGVLLVAAGKVIPYLFVIFAFTFIYMFVPNTHVQFRSALTGALVAGVSWEFAGWLFTELAARSTRLTAIYSSFAILVMFMIWLYVSWIIVLAGSQVAFFVQNPELVRYGLKRGEVGGRTMERISLSIMYLIGSAYEDQHTPWSREQLARRLHLPTDHILDVLDRLAQRGLIMVVSGKIRRYIPAYDIGKMPLREAIMAVRRNPVKTGDPDRHIKPIPQAEEMMLKMDMAANEALGKLTMKEYVDTGEKQELETKTVLLARQSPRK